METVLVMYLAGSAFIIFGIIFIRKSGRWNSFFAFIMFLFAGLFIASTQEWIRGFFKNYMYSTLYQTTQKLGGKIDQFESTTAEMKSELEETQDNIIASQNELKIKQADLTALADKISQNPNFPSTKQENLGDSDELLDKFFKESIIDIFANKSERMTFVPVSEKAAVVLFELSAMPFPQSVRLQYHIFLQPPNSYFLANNIVIFMWNDSIEKLKEKSFYIYYTKDPKSRNVHSKFSYKDTKLYIDAVPVEVSQDSNGAVRLNLGKKNSNTDSSPMNSSTP